MGRPPKYKKDVISDDSSRWKILSAAAELFIEQGYENVTAKQIIDKAGVLNGTLYYFFNGKEEILEAIFVEQMNRTFDEVVENLKTTDDELELFLHPVAILLYVTRKSKKVANLYYHAHSSRKIVDRIIGMMRDRIYGAIPEYEKVLSSEIYRLNHYITLGLLRTYFGLFAYDDVPLDYRDALRTIAKITAVQFDYHIFNMEVMIDGICKRVEANSLTFGICGYELKIDN